MPRWQNVDNNIQSTPCGTTRFCANERQLNRSSMHSLWNLHRARFSRPKTRKPKHLSLMCLLGCWPSVWIRADGSFFFLTRRETVTVPSLDREWTTLSLSSETANGISVVWFYFPFSTTDSFLHLYRSLTNKKRENPKEKSWSNVIESLCNVYRSSDARVLISNDNKWSWWCVP